MPSASGNRLISGLRNLSEWPGCDVCTTGTCYHHGERVCTRGGGGGGGGVGGGGVGGGGGGRPQRREAVMRQATMAVALCQMGPSVKCAGSRRLLPSQPVRSLAPFFFYVTSDRAAPPDCRERGGWVSFIGHALLAAQRLDPGAMAAARPHASRHRGRHCERNHPRIVSPFNSGLRMIDSPAARTIQGCPRRLGNGTAYPGNPHFVLGIRGRREKVAARSSFTRMRSAPTRRAMGSVWRTR